MPINWAKCIIKSNYTFTIYIFFSKPLCVSEVKILTYDINYTFASFAFILTNGKSKELSFRCTHNVL